MVAIRARKGGDGTAAADGGAARLLHHVAHQRTQREPKRREHHALQSQAGRWSCEAAGALELNTQR